MIFCNVPQFFMFIIFFVLIYNMRKYHFYEAKLVQKSMICFVLFELFIQIPYVLEYIHSSDNWKEIGEFMFLPYLCMVLGFYLVLQSFSIIYLKPSKDPIEGISYLDYLQLLSINQRINKDFLQHLYADAQWKHLSSDQKRELKQAFYNKSLSSSNEIRETEDGLILQDDYDYSKESA